MVLFTCLDPLVWGLIMCVAYNKAAPPSAIPGFDGPTELGGAINAPLGYMGYK
jgi:hypothetical protein